MTPGAKILSKAEARANRVRVPMTHSRLGLAELGKRAAKEIGDDHVGAFSASLAFRGLLAIFPFSIFLLSLLGVFGAGDLLGDLLQQTSAALPEEATALLADQIDALTDPDSKGQFALGAIIASLLALWGASGAFRSVMEAMNVMYEVEEKRGLVRRYVTSILMSLGVAALFVAALVLVVAGPDIARAIAGETTLGDAFVWTWSIAQWPILFALVLLAFALVYYMAPNVAQEFRFLTIGAIIGGVLWLLFSLAFSAYVNNFGSYNATYGTIAGVVILMLYLYYSSYMLLVGAEINQIVEDANPEGKDEGQRGAKDA